MVLLQDLAIEVNGEEFWSRAHADQMPADVVLGTNGDICERKRDGGKARQSALCGKNFFTPNGSSSCYCARF
ncbi:hypothetical protein D623_10000369 [Myotis brandtii]|uniref:Uncharacterized protein n=1 Tax=Myotis brandtii TaxID=109478 RepID=S7QAX5_MYOBR|nr:hypothetical protein D623_10000369 [Myotis brandtii]